MKKQGCLQFLPLLALFALSTLSSCTAKDPQPVHEKQVVVIGGGIAGLAAARQILIQGRGRYTVRVFEARRERFGGRVWTDTLKNPKARGLEVDLGATTLNIASLSNPLVNLTRDLELETATISRPQLIVPWLNKKFSDDELMKGLMEAGSVIAKAVNKTRMAGKDVSIKQAVDKELQEQGVDNKDPSVQLVKSLPSYIIEEYSALHYQPDSRDFGFETVLLNGMGELVDRLLSGSVDEPVLKISLRTAVRQIKVDKSKGKVTLRLKDGSQVTVDEVVVAVPGAVMANGDLLFEPILPKEYQWALKQMGIADGNKVIVEFDAPFWPDDFGQFILAVESEKERGNLQTWINVHKLLGKPVLTGLLLGNAAREFETLTDDQVRTTVLQKLQTMFGASSVSDSNIVSIRRSAWSSDQWAGGASSYPKVGNNPGMWDVFSEPLCPGIYFAGEHTLFRGHGTLHGAYTSGLRAADQLLSGYCAQKLAEEERKRKEEARRKAELKKKKNKTGTNTEDEGKEEEKKEGEEEEEEEKKEEGEEEDREKEREREEERDEL